MYLCIIIIIIIIIIIYKYMCVLFNENVSNIDHVPSNFGKIDE